MRTQVIHGCSFEEIKKIEKNSIDLIYTDPPYGKKYISNIAGDKRWNKSGITDGRFEDVMLGDGDDHDDENWFIFFKWCYHALKDNTYMYLHCDTRFMARHFANIEKRGFNYKGIISWHKNFAVGGDLKGSFKQDWEPIIYFSKGNPTLNPIWVMRKNEKVLRERISASSKDWEFSLPKKEKCGHKTQKPVDLARQIIQLASPANGLVLDPFCGSGTTLVAAHVEGRRAIGFEKSENYVNMVKKRLTDASQIAM